MKPIKVTMTLLVRNEEDIIEDNIWFHRSQGIDSFIIMDNLSTDRTADIIKSMTKELDIDYVFQPEDDYSQSDWVTKMARRAYFEHHADWVINNDADEFWITKNRNLKDLLSAVPAELSALLVRRHNAVLTYEGNCALMSTAHPKYSILFERNSVNNLGRPLPGKCVHRAAGTVVVSQGNHSVEGVFGGTLEVDEDIRILHYPYRSLKQYKQKIRIGGAAYERNNKLPSSVGLTWREHYKAIETDAIDQFWTAITRPKHQVLIDKIENKIFEEKTVVDFTESRLLQKRESRLRHALSHLHENTAATVNDFVLSQAKLISQIPESDRKYRPIFYNLQYCINGPIKHLDKVMALYEQGPTDSLYKDFPGFRDTFSLFPRNSNFETFLGETLTSFFPDDVSRLRSDCRKNRVIMHVSCFPRKHLADNSIASFLNAGDDYHHITVVGSKNISSENETDLSISYDGQTLTVPVPDDYENLHRKIFYALTILYLTTDTQLVIKVDDNIRLKCATDFNHQLSIIEKNGVQYAGRLIGSATHQAQWHGWHIGKCADPVIESRGYQYPLPRNYAAGGYGYVLGRQGIKACAYMYLAMKEFFSMRSVGLEDAFVGHAMHAQGIELHDVASEKNLLAFPGLVSIETEEL